MIRLTQTVQKGGCAAKVAANDLRRLLSIVKLPPSVPAVLVDGGTFDDAAIYQINSEQALVQTLDFFTPIVDTPKLFGRIAAANALSDVYAMGGTPVTAMAILAFPVANLSDEIIADVLQGASDALSEARCPLVGGHTIDDDTLKFGLSVTGLIHPQRIWTNASAKVGDDLILTKALGTGTLTAALKRSELTENDIDDALQSMGQLNNVLSSMRSELSTSIHAATDITGFGLAGHALNMARASQVSLHFSTHELPRFERALELLERGFVTKAHRTNREYVRDTAQILTDHAALTQLLFDPQTSGGLLLAVDPVHSAAIVESLQKNFKAARIVGKVKTLEKTYLSFQ